MKYLFAICALVILAWSTTPVIYGHEDVDPNTVVIHMNDQGYDPQSVTITVGQKIVFENEGTSDRWPASNIHPTHRGYPNSDVTDCGTEKERFMFDACRGIKPQGTYTFEFNEVGQWRYHDHIDSRMAGTITVDPAPADNSQPGFLQRVWIKVSDWIDALFLEQDTDINLNTSSNTPNGKSPLYDETITLDSKQITSDPNLIYSYVRKFGAQAALQQLSSLEDEYGLCHDNAHNVGRFTYELYGEEAFSECSTLCQSGCYHGAVEAYFREAGTTNLKAGINSLCSSTDQFITYQCRHGVGHGLMAWTNYQLFEALEGCDLLDSIEAQHACYSGVFMENIGQSMAKSLGIEVHTTEYLSNDPHYPCNIVGEKYKSICYFLQTDQMTNLANGNTSIAALNCDEVQEIESRSSCFMSLGRTIGGRSSYDHQWAIEQCSLVGNTEDRSRCLFGAISNTFWDKSQKDDALTFCSLLTIPAEKNMCYELIFSKASDVIYDLAERKMFCGEAEPAFTQWCEESIVTGYLPST